MRTFHKYQVESVYLFGLDVHSTAHWEGCANKKVGGHFESVD